MIKSLPYDCIRPDHMAQIINMVEEGYISRQTARDVQEVFLISGMLKKGLCLV